jgi:mRNA-degrading endonuclease RelE of RelBE toxin-antitoxin system
MISRIGPEFHRRFARLPTSVQKQARIAYGLFKSNPYHRSLHFKKLPPYADLWSVRVGGDYRAIGRWRGDVIVWFFIGSHAEYDKLLR